MAEKGRIRADKGRKNDRIRADKGRKMTEKGRQRQKR